MTATTDGDVLRVTCNDRYDHGVLRVENDRAIGEHRGHVAALCGKDVEPIESVPGSCPECPDCLRALSAPRHGVPGRHRGPEVAA